MRILAIQEIEFPHITMGKYLLMLKEAGHEVHLLAAQTPGRPMEENWRGATVHRLFSPDRNKLWELAENVRFRVTFRRPKQERVIEDLVDRIRPDAIQVYDLPQCRSAILVAKRRGIPVVVDFEERFPEKVLLWRKIGGWQGFKNRFLLGFKRWREYEMEVMKQADHVICVDPLTWEKYLRYEADMEKMHIIPNTVLLKEFDSQPVKEEIVQRYQGRFVIGYMGGFQPCRGLELALRAMPLIRKEAPNALLLMVGRGTIDHQLRQLATSLNLGDMVEFTGWRPYEEMRSYMEASDIGIMPLEHVAQYEPTRGIKLFEYMAVRLPILVSDCEGQKRLMEETEAGLVFRAGDVDDYAQKVIQLARDAELRKRLGENGRRAVETKYNWEMSAGPELAAIYDDLSKRRGVGR